MSIAFILILFTNHDSLLEEHKAYRAYVSEGAFEIQDWDMVMKYQKKNGSLLNSPSTTAAVLTWLQNSTCREYLNSTLKIFGNAGIFKRIMLALEINLKHYYLNWN